MLNDWWFHIAVFGSISLQIVLTIILLDNIATKDNMILATIAWVYCALISLSIVVTAGWCQKTQKTLIQAGYLKSRHVVTSQESVIIIPMNGDRNEPTLAERKLGE